LTLPGLWRGASTAASWTLDPLDLFAWQERVEKNMGNGYIIREVIKINGETPQ
jgi:hypothetical protein